MSVCAVAKLLCSEQDLFTQLSMKRQTGAPPRQRKSRITKEKREGETGHLSPLWTAGQDTELFAYRTERIQKQRIRLKDSPKEQFLLKHHPARNWNLAEIRMI